MDEAMPMHRAWCLASGPAADRLILAGDHCQLPPTVVSAEPARDGLGTSLMERLIEHRGQSIYRRLTGSVSHARIDHEVFEPTVL